MRSGSSELPPGEEAILLLSPLGPPRTPMGPTPFLRPPFEADEPGGPPEAGGGREVEAEPDLDVCTLIRMTIRPARMSRVDTRPTIIPMRKWGLPEDSCVDVSAKSYRRYLGSYHLNITYIDTYVCNIDFST